MFQYFKDPEEEISDVLTRMQPTLQPCTEIANRDYPEHYFDVCKDHFRD